MKTEYSGNMDSSLDLKAIPKLIGMDDEFKRVFHMFQYSRLGLYLSGYAGTGKTVFGQNILKAYARKYGVPAYYVQGTVETTKTSLIAGHRLQAGSMVAAKALVGQAMDEGAAVMVDEYGHLVQEIMVTFNSILDRWRVTSIGDIAIVAAPTFRVIFAGNPATHAANTLLPQSFASRLYGIRFDYPKFDLELRITKAVTEANYDFEVQVPEVVQRYIVGLFRKYRSPVYPLMARNMAAAIIALSVEAHYSKGPGNPYQIENEAVARNITAIAHMNASQMPEVVREFGAFYGKIGAQRFRDCLEGAALTHLDIDTGQDVGARARLSAAILSKTWPDGKGNEIEEQGDVDDDVDPDMFDRAKSASRTSPWATADGSGGYKVK
jgi:hypothetical protein